ncbi:MAG: DUF1217 domain-containing protein [Rhodobacteraceae bacterium]|nr:DUF1217 domain-containing protein [Paracoccaceae bacterium]
MISISGLSSNVALNLLDSTRDRQLELLNNEPVHKRAAEAFAERISSISTPEEFVADFEVYSFVMRAFDLEDQIFGRGLIRKTLESDPEDPASLLNRLTDQRFREMHLALGFTTAEGPQTPDFTSEAFVEAVTTRYFNRVYINNSGDQNSTVGTVLEFREQADSINNWFEILRDRDLTRFFQTALGIPESVSGLDLDVQRRIFEEKFDLADLADPEERERLTTRFIAISDALNPPAAAASSVASSLLVSFGTGPQIIPITLDVTNLPIGASRLYQ